jgi:hypothetical protein
MNFFPRTPEERERFKLLALGVFYAGMGTFFFVCNFWDAMRVYGGLIILLPIPFTFALLFYSIALL